MKLINLILAFIFLLPFQGCYFKPNEKDYNIDFLNRIDVLETFCPQKEETDEFVAISVYLWQLTGRLPNCELEPGSHIFGCYGTVIYLKEDFEEDKKYWLKWYEGNKTNKFLFEKGDSIYNLALERIALERIPHY